MGGRAGELSRAFLPTNLGWTDTWETRENSYPLTSTHPSQLARSQPPSFSPPAFSSPSLTYTIKFLINKLKCLCKPHRQSSSPDLWKCCSQDRCYWSAGLPTRPGLALMLSTRKSMRPPQMTDWLERRPERALMTEYLRGMFQVEGTSRSPMRPSGMGKEWGQRTTGKAVCFIKTWAGMVVPVCHEFG